MPNTEVMILDAPHNPNSTKVIAAKCHDCGVINVIAHHPVYGDNALTASVKAMQHVADTHTCITDDEETSSDE